MKISELKETIATLLDTKLCIYVSGPPGVGKSAGIHQVIAARHVRQIDVRAALLDSVDLRGIPVPDVKKGMTRWLPPCFLPTEGEGVLFFDEVGHAVPAVQNALFQLFLDRQLGEYTLPPGWRVIAASNRAEDRAGSFRLNSGLASRMVHLTLDVDHDDWQRWALESGVAPEVRSFLRFKPQFLWQFDPAKAGDPFPCPRSWEFTSRVFANAAGRGWAHDAVSGCVGPGAAAEFMAHVRLCHTLPDLDELLKSPATAPVPKEASLMYATLGALTERARKAKQPQLDSIATYVTRFPLEFATMAIFELQVAVPKSITSPAVMDWLTKHSHALSGLSA